MDAVTAAPQRAASACRSAGFAMSPCIVLQAGKPTFEIGATEVEMGMGIHGEPVVWLGEPRKADAIAEERSDILLADNPAQGRVSVMANSLGAAPPEELYILCRVVKRRLETAGAEIVMPLVGRYATSLEMAGASTTLCHLDDDLERLLKAPADCTFWKV